VLTPRAVGGAGPGFGDLIYTEATGKTKSGTGTSCAAPTRKGCAIYRTSVSNSSKSLSSGTTTPSDYPTASGKNCANNSKRPWPTTKPARANYTRALTRRLKKLDERESRLIDLAADAALPLGQDTPVTAELSQVSKEFRDDYEKRSGTELEYRTSVLADAVYALEVSVAAFERERRRKPNTKPGAARFEYGHQGARKVELTGLELPTPDCQCENACAAACHTVYGVSDNACLQPVFVLMCLGRACG
jgi:hypothetical protein